jgi:hypothetical protein
MIQVPEKHQILRETEVFGRVHQIDERFRSKTTFENFKRYIADGLLPGIELPDDRILGYLYERAIDAKTDRAWVRAIQKIARSKSWKEYMKWLDDTTSRARELVLILKTKPQRLPGRDKQQAKSLAQSLEDFRSRLLEIHRLERRASQIKEVSNKNASLKRARDGMDRTLRTNCPDLNGIQRAEVIAQAVEAIGLKKEDTRDATIRQLSRVHRRKKEIEARVRSKSRQNRRTLSLGAKT